MDLNNSWPIHHSWRTIASFDEPSNKLSQTGRACGTTNKVKFYGRNDDGMSTASTIVVKRPSADDFSCTRIGQLKEYSTSFIAICLWGIAAIVSAANTDISPNATGISVSIKTQDVLLMLAMTYMLGRGLKESNYLLVLPWIMVSIWNMYHVHYTSLVKMGLVLKQTRTMSKLPWIALAIDLLGLVMRMLLTCRVAHLAMNQWCNRQLETHLKKKYPRQGHK